MKKEKLEETVSLIKERINKTNYRAAIGSYFIDKNSTATFEEALRVSEELMYVDKATYYKSAGIDRRKI